MFDVAKTHTHACTLAMRSVVVQLYALVAATSNFVTAVTSQNELSFSLTHRHTIAY